MEKFHHPPAFCPVHGLFPATGFAIGVGAMQNSFIGCTQSCPKCGRPSEIIPGVYDSTETGLNILLDKSVSTEALAAIRLLVERLQKSEISYEQARAEAEKISPKVGKLFDIANWSDQAKATLYGAIIAATAVLGAARIASSPNQTVNINPVVIERIIEQRKTGLLSSSSMSPIERTPLPRPRPKQPR